MASGRHDDALADNPFFVLGLTPCCSRQQIEREGQKLLGLLELGVVKASTYTTPLGPRPRTPELVRTAMAQLRDPKRRIVHELWADLVQASNLTQTDEGTEAPPETDEDPAHPPWPEVWRLFDWRVG